MLLVSAVAVCIAGLFIGFILQKNRVNLKRKDTEILYRDELFQKLSMNVVDVFLMLDAKTYKADYVSPNVEKLLGITVAPVSYTHLNGMYMKPVSSCDTVKLCDCIIFVQYICHLRQVLRFCFNFKIA